jgi:hypothetical protein
MLLDTNQRDTATEIFGHKVPAPIGFAPVGINKIYHPLGELPVASAIGELGLPYCLSTAGSQPIEDIGSANDAGAKKGSEGEGSAVRFFQLYIPHDDELTRSLLQRAADSGFTACILTLDTWQLGWRHDDVATSNYAFYHGFNVSIWASIEALDFDIRTMFLIGSENARSPKCCVDLAVVNPLTLKKEGVSIRTATVARPPGSVRIQTPHIFSPGDIGK